MSQPIERRSGRRITRREFNKITLVLAGVGALALTGCEVAPTPEPDLSFLEKISEIESEFNITILSDPWVRPGLSWDQETLDILRSHLQVLPVSLFSQKFQNKKLTIAMKHGFGALCDCVTDSNSENPDTIKLSRDLLLYTDPLISFGTTAHELAHRKSNLKRKKNNEYESPFFSSIDTLFARPYQEINSELRKRIKTNHSDLVNKFKKEDFRFSLHLIDGKSLLDELTAHERWYLLFYNIINKDNNYPIEFIAFAAETYIMGKDKFVTYFGEFMDAEIADSLYQFVKNDIFEGQEYEDGVQIDTDENLVYKFDDVFGTPAYPLQESVTV